MDYVVEKMEAFTLIGVSRQVKFASAYQDIPVFWDEFCKKYCQRGQEKAECKCYSISEPFKAQTLTKK